MSESQPPAELEARFQKAVDWINRLKQEPFNQETEEKLSNHPFLIDAEKGSLAMPQKRAFVCEQLAIQRSDAVSFAFLAGHMEFRPKSLTTATAPSPINGPYYKEYEDLFQFLLGGELYAANLLLDHARYLGLEGEAAMASCQRVSPLAQAYPSYWARLALSRQRSAGAAACAVNFPAWGTMCGRLAKAYGKADQSLPADGGCKELAFIQFFATPIENLNELAAAVMMQDEEITYEEVAEHVRLLQEYELLFWDACYNAK